MTCVERRIGPLEDEDPWARPVLHPGAHSGDAAAQFVHQGLRPRFGAGGSPDLAHAGDHLVEALGVE